MAKNVHKEDITNNGKVGESEIEQQRKKEALKRTLDLIEKRFGTGSIQKLTNDGSRHIPSISTGTLALDIALGVGGVPRKSAAAVDRGNVQNRASSTTQHVLSGGLSAKEVAADIQIEYLVVDVLGRFEEVDGTAPHRMHSDGEITMAGDENDRREGNCPVEFLL